MSLALLFSLEKETLALPLAEVTEVVRAAWPMRAPRAPFGCLGVMDVRGQLVPLLDTAAMLGLRRSARADVLLQRLVESHVLLVHAAPNTVGLLVDQVVDVGEISSAVTDEERARLQPKGRQDLVMGLALTQGRRALLLNPSVLVGERRLRLLRRTVEASTVAGTL